MSAHTSADRQVLRMDVPGNWILEAKVGTYKLYTRSFLNLLMDREWISDEVSDLRLISIVHLNMIFYRL